MHSAVLLATLALSAASPAGAVMSDDERAYCASELEVVENRQKLFETQGLSPAEIARKNDPQTRDLKECRDRFGANARRADEQRQDVEEVTRRVGPNATELERDRAWKEVRRERLASKSPSTLTSEERAELAAGAGDELKTTEHALDDAHQRDPQFMRIVHSAIACYQGERRNELAEAIGSEERLLKVGTGDKQKLYKLRSELRASEEILARNAEAVRTLPNGIDRCTTPTIAVVTHCLGVRFTGAPPEPACESEQIQQYVRFVK
jgi:hypothetical protein